MSLRNWLDLLGARGIFAFVVFLVLCYFGISGWISDGWSTGLSIIVGAISAAAAIVAHGRAVILDGFLSVAALVLTLIGFSQYHQDSLQHTNEGVAAYEKAYAACMRGDATGCDEGMKVFKCKYMESNQDLMRAATSANININAPKEISSVVDMNAQHDINMLPPECQPKR